MCISNVDKNSKQSAAARQQNIVRVVMLFEKQNEYAHGNQLQWHDQRIHALFGWALPFVSAFGVCVRACVCVCDSPTEQKLYKTKRLCMQHYFIHTDVEALFRLFGNTLQDILHKYQKPRATFLNPSCQQHLNAHTHTRTQYSSAQIDCRTIIMHMLDLLYGNIPFPGPIHRKICVQFIYR